MQSSTLQITYRPIESLIPYARNSRTHSDAQVAQIAASIKEFGWTNPVLIDGEGGIIAGHGRVMAGRKLGIKEAPCIVLDNLTEAQRRAYVIADNKLALNAGWDVELLKVELKDLDTEKFDLTLTGFEIGELATLFDETPVEEEQLSENYSRKIEAPIYKPTGDKPKISELFSRERAEQLLKEINEAKIQEDIKQFLRHAAERHTVFNFRNIAEYYSHATEDIQDLMEKSALVIIDFNKAVENGFVKLSEAMMQQAEKSKEKNHA